MKKIFRDIQLWFHGVMLNVGIALHRTEEHILKADPNDLNESNKHNQRIRHKNPLAEKMLQGQRDEKFVQDFYEVLKRADKFLKNATPEQIEAKVDKHGMTLGKKDKWGRRYDHFGFFDPKSKHYGKTMKEVMELQLEERKTKDDDYPLEFMIKNTPVIDVASSLKSTENGEIVSLSTIEKSKKYKFPVRVVRNKEVFNKIEQLTEYLHVKKRNSKDRILEFFVPKKYKTIEHKTRSKIFKELKDIQQVWFNDEYGTPYFFQIKSYYKRVDFDENYEIIKFKASVIEKQN